jgi:hypothetical protein
MFNKFVEIKKTFYEVRIKCEALQMEFSDIKLADHQTNFKDIYWSALPAR